MTEYPRTTKEAYYPRTLKEAFGPHTDETIEEEHCQDWKDQTVMVVCLVGFVLALVLDHVYPHL